MGCASHSEHEMPRKTLEHTDPSGLPFTSKESRAGLTGHQSTSVNGTELPAAGAGEAARLGRLWEGFVGTRVWSLRTDRALQSPRPRSGSPSLQRRSRGALAPRERLFLPGRGGRRLLAEVLALYRCLGRARSSPPAETGPGLPLSCVFPAFFVFWPFLKVLL